MKHEPNYQINTESVERRMRRNKSFAPLWSDVFGRNLLGKMLIYPLHCRLPPPPFKMWLFSDGQGNFDPLRLLWSETPFNRSSAQELKLILSLPTTASLQKFGVKAKALPSCQSCWQPAELKALSNADDQCEWLAANGLHSHSLSSGGWALSHTLGQERFFISFQGNDEVCKLSYLLLYSSGVRRVFMRLPFSSLSRCDSGCSCSEAVNRLGFATVPPLSSCEVTAVKHCHCGVTEEQKCD